MLLLLKALSKRAIQDILTQKPAISDDLNFINRYNTSIKHNLGLELEAKQGFLNIEIPVQTKVRFHIPTGKITDIQEENKSIANMATITVLKVNKHKDFLEIGSQSYSFFIKARL